MPYFKINGGTSYFTENTRYFKIDWKPNSINSISFWGQSEKRYFSLNEKNILEWTDNSGNINIGFQSNENSSPVFEENVINGYSSIKFQDNNFISVPLSLNYFTIFTVIKSTSNEIVYEYGDSTNEYTGFYLNGDYNTIAVSNSGISNSATIKSNGNDWLGDNTWKIIVHKYDGTHLGHKLYINNTLQNIPTYFEYNDNPGVINEKYNLNLGARSDSSDGINAYIPEFIVYNEALSYTNIVKITNYLNNKYQIF
jgi:hypothetical protein